MIKGHVNYVDLNLVGTLFIKYLCVAFNKGKLQHL